MTEPEAQEVLRNTSPDLLRTIEALATLVLFRNRSFHPSMEMEGLAAEAKYYRQLVQRNDYVRVPREPTEAMLSAGDSTMPQIAPGQDITTGYDALKEAWPAMVDAALSSAQENTP